MKAHKLHVILHIGSPKTGSTALQSACRAHAPALLAAGVLYPEVRSHAISHHFLGMLMLAPQQQPKVYGPTYVDQPELLQADFAEHWQDIKRQVRLYKPSVLLLSSEALFIVPEPERAAELRRLLDELADSFEIVAYIRRPSAFYLSKVQQSLKHSAHFSPPGAISFRHVVESWEIQLGVPVKLAPFMRESLRDGDIFRDFISRYLPQVSLNSQLVAKTTNETLSAEVMALLQDYHRCNHPDKERWRVEGSRRFRRLMEKIDVFEGSGQRPVLSADIAGQIDRSSVDLLWLNSRYGISFSGVDLAEVGANESTLNRPDYQVADICEVDQARKERLMLLAMQTLLAPKINKPARMTRWLARNQNRPWLRGLRNFIRPLRQKWSSWL